MNTTIRGEDISGEPKVWTNWGAIITTLPDGTSTLAMTPQEARKYAISLLQAADRVEEIKV